MPTAYDQIADWYGREFLGRQQAAGADPLGIDQALRGLLGYGSGICLETGCGTGVRAATIRELGWTPVGVDLSAGMLRHARDRPCGTHMPRHAASVRPVRTTRTHWLRPPPRAEAAPRQYP